MVNPTTTCPNDDYKSNDILDLKSHMKNCAEIRKCKVCEQQKPSHDFNVIHQIKNEKLYLNKTCKKCQYKINSKKEKNPKVQYNQIKKSADIRNYKFELTYWQYFFMRQDPCYLCNKPGPHNLDRIRNEEGYNSINAIACCTMCNRIKSDFKLQELREQIKRMEANVLPF